jgi:hypothetical protein
MLVATVALAPLTACSGDGQQDRPAGPAPVTEKATLGSDPGAELAVEVTKDLRERHPGTPIEAVACDDFDRIAAAVTVACRGVVDGTAMSYTVRFRDEYGYYDLSPGVPQPSRTG